jgi:diguanylate cyclase (GGDEF)-like protein
MLRKIHFNRTRAPEQPQPNFGRSVSLRWMLTVPFIIQVIAVVGLVGYLSYRNGETAVEDLTNQLMETVSVRVEQKLTSYLANARLANQLMSDTVRRGDIVLDLDRQNLPAEKYLWDQMQVFDNLTWISLGTEATNASLGIWRPSTDRNLQFSQSNRASQYFGNYHAIDSQGKRSNLVKIEKPAFYPRTRPWYKAAVAAKTGIWTDIYAGFTPGTVFIAASQPLYDRVGKLVGVSGIDLSLVEIQKFLAQHPVSLTGQTFIIERSGVLVASSTQDPPFRMVAGKPQRMYGTNSDTRSIRETAKALQREVGEFKAIGSFKKFQFDLDGERQFVQVRSFAQRPGLDWLVITVVPATDVMGQIHTGRQTTIGLCLLAVFGVIGLNTSIGRRLIRPIRSLSRASQQIAQGDFSNDIDPSSIKELSTLTDSFNLMSQEIQDSRQQLQDYSKSLEQKVEDRTQALQTEVQQRIEAETALQAANEELQRLAYLDGLTQIANRRHFDERLVQEWRRMQRQQLPLSLILCDVDYFKQYNDTYGHQAGDECLRQVAVAISGAARRASDLTARYGGEEFVAILPNTSLDGALQVASAIQARIASLQLKHVSSPIDNYVTASFGVVCTIPRGLSTPTELLYHVDRTLYQAKVDGRNRICHTEI